MSLVNLETKEVIRLNWADPYGRGLSEDAPTPWIFAGKNYDAEAGVVYFGARYYLPELKRWLTPDPLEQSDDLYQYCFDSPLKYVDLDGRWALTLVRLGWGAGGLMTSPLWGSYAIAAGAGAAVGYCGYKVYEVWQEKQDKSNKKEPPYNGKDLGEDASKRPTKGFEWKGKGDPKSGRGAWHNPDTGESLHPDFNHKGDMKPHWDYIGPDG